MNRFSLVALAAICAVFLLASPRAVFGQIVVSHDPVPISINGFSDLDVNGDGSANLQFGWQNLTTFDVPSSGGSYSLLVRPVPGSRILIGDAGGIREGVRIGPGTPQADWEGQWPRTITSYQFPDGETWSGPVGEDGFGYVGFSFESIEGIHYGWVRADLGESDGAMGSWPGITSWAYQAEPDVAITAGAIPEPSHVAILAGLAVLGMALVRRRRAGR